MNKIKSLWATLSISVMGVAFSTANAAIAAADLTAITTEVTTDLGVVLTFALGLLALVLAPQMGYKILKKFANAAV